MATVPLNQASTNTPRSVLIFLNKHQLQPVIFQYHPNCCLDHSASASTCSDKFLLLWDDSNMQLVSFAFLGVVVLLKLR